MLIEWHLYIKNHVFICCWVFLFTILTSLGSFSWQLKVSVCWEHTSWRSWPPGLFPSQWFWAAVWSRTQSRVIYTYWLPPAAPIARAEARHAWLRRIHKHPTESGLMEFPSKVTDKARHAVPDTAGAANKMSPNASMKERPGKTARWKSQLLIWVGINQLGRRSPAPLIGPCSPGRPGWGLLLSKGWHKNTRGLLEADQGRAPVAKHYPAAPVRPAAEPQWDLVEASTESWEPRR